MEEAKKFRQYAADCRRLAEKSSAKDRAILLEIADAWTACAERAERSSATGKANFSEDEHGHL